MTLTIDRTEFRPGRGDEQPTPPPAASEPPDGSVNAERWLEVMYGIRPNSSLRRTFVPMTDRHAAGVVDWLRTMWGITSE
jgi:hypothetical protein